MEWLRHKIESLFDNLGLVMAPIGAAVMIGLSVQHYLESHLYLAGSIIMGVVAAFALEMTGYRAFKAFQLKGNWWLPVTYLICAAVAVTVIEWLVFEDFNRWMIGLVFVAVAAVMYWADTVINSESNAIEQQIEMRKKLEAAGMTLDKTGKVVQKRSKNTPTQLQLNSKNNSNKLRWNTLLPEVKQDISELSYSQFCGKHGAVSESTFYHWQSRIDKEVV